MSGSFMAMRPCPGCGFVASRKVWPAGFLGRGEETVRDCPACCYLASARRHEDTALRLREKARAMIKRRSVRR